MENIASAVKLNLYEKVLETYFARIFPSSIFDARNYEEKDRILKGSGSLCTEGLFILESNFLLLEIGSKNASEFCTVDKFEAWNEHTKKEKKCNRS